MRRKAFLVSAICVIMTVVSSCTGTGLMLNINVTCEEFERKSPNLENEFELRKGDKIKAILCANPSTGYSWECVAVDESIMKLEKHEYLAADGGVVGATGTDIWIFRAVSEGSTEIRMEYSQPWEGGAKRANTYTMDVSVLGDR